MLFGHIFFGNIHPVRNGDDIADGQLLADDKIHLNGDFGSIVPLEKGSQVDGALLVQRRMLVIHANIQRQQLLCIGVKPEDPTAVYPLPVFRTLASLPTRTALPALARELTHRLC